jgi:hypothetical protein
MWHGRPARDPFSSFVACDNTWAIPQKMSDQLPVVVFPEAAYGQGTDNLKVVEPRGGVFIVSGRRRDDRDNSSDGPGVLDQTGLERSAVMPRPMTH